MEGTTTLRAHERTSPHRTEGTNITVCRRSIKHVRWLYRAFRNDGLKPDDARMNLVFALAAGQRDMRTRVEDTLRTVR